MKKRMFAILCVLALLTAMMAGCGGKKTSTVKMPEVSTIAPGAAVDIPAAIQQTPPAQQPVQGSGDTYTVYTQIRSSWKEAYLWAWSETEGDLFEAWPGEPMKKISDCWYAMDIPVEYDYVIVNDNGYPYTTQTQDLRTEAEDLWVIWCDDGDEGYFYNKTNTEELYEGAFLTMSISDEKDVSDDLSSMSVLMFVEGITCEMEYGYNSDGVREFSYVYYIDMTDMNDSDIAATAEAFRSGQFQQVFGNVDCVEMRDELRNNHLVITVHFRDLDDPSNVKKMVDAFALAGTDFSSLVDQNGRFTLSSVWEMEEAGFYVKLS